MSFGPFIIHNHCNVPVNIAVKNANFIYFYKNNLLPEAEENFDIEAVWYDVAIFYATPDNEIDPAKHNWEQALGVGMLTASALAAAASAIVTMGAATPLGVALMAQGITLATGGIVLTTVSDHALRPHEVPGCYGGDRNRFDVHGGVTVRGNTATFQEMQIKWKNETNGNCGTY